MKLKKFEEFVNESKLSNFWPVLGWELETELPVTDVEMVAFGPKFAHYEIYTDTDNNYFIYFEIKGDMIEIEFQDSTENVIKTTSYEWRGDESPIDIASQIKYERWV